MAYLRPGEGLRMAHSFRGHSSKRKIFVLRSRNSLDKSHHLAWHASCTYTSHPSGKDRRLSCGT
jgi:hypothetical protein